MSTINQDDWRFQLSNSSKLEKAQGINKPDTFLIFHTAGDLITHLGKDPTDLYLSLHNKIEDRIKGNSTYLAWKKQRSLLKDLKHFSLYRKNKYDHYHAAARAVFSNTANSKQATMVSEFDNEIQNSSNIIPAEQILFHGRANCELVNSHHYASYISTSLHPIVARNSAFRRAGDQKKNGHPCVFVLTLKISLPALWGQVANSSEYELLLPRNLIIKETQRVLGSNYHTVFAEIIDRK